MTACLWCNGTGKEWITCGLCDGKGCQLCRMVGQVKVPCKLCGGSGSVSK